ncbi:MAG: RNA-directed DNA polymerase [Methylococcales bacterium]
MTVDKDFAEEALLRYNYFPFQKRMKEELPPIFTSRQLVPDVADKITAIKHRKEGYDQVEYLMTRHTNVSRPISIPHPLPYCHLVKSIIDNWDKFSYVCENNISKVKPEHHSDGRLLLMDYGDDYSKTDIALRYGFGKNFRVHTDITNCFPSIYTHAIPWALVGFQHSKKNRQPKHWFNKIDFCQRMLKRGETQGIAIGPATSNIISEAILARIDEVLSKEFSYFRYIDDYTCYCESYEDGQSFLRRLREELKKYKLVLNIKKTKTVDLPSPIEDDWIVDLSTRMPIGYLNNEKLKVYSSSESIRFIDYAIRINEKYPDGSVLKYAVKSIINRLDDGAKKQVLEYLLNLVRHFPILLPLIDKPLAANADLKFIYTKYLNVICIENALEGRSDGIAWSLYYLNFYRLPISYEVTEKVIASRDCIGIILLYLSGVFDDEILAFVNAIDKTDVYELDQYWLLFYQLFFDGKCPNPYSSDTTFDVLKAEDVSFINREGHESTSEKKFSTKKVQKLFSEILDAEIALSGVVKE